VVDVVQPFLVKHVVRTTTERYHTSELIMMGVCHPDGVKATGAKRPCHNLILLDAFLLGDPLEHARPLTVRTLGVHRCCGRVTCAGDFEDQGCDADLTPALHPGAEFGAVAVETGHDDDERRGSLAAVGVEVVGGDFFAFAFDGVCVGNLDFYDRVFTEAGEQNQLANEAVDVILAELTSNP